MELYLVIGRDYEDVELDDPVLGLFSSKERAQEIADEMTRNFIDHKDNITVEIVELVVDQPTDVYHFFKYN
jgi:hypothetical protein